MPRETINTPHHQAKNSADTTQRIMLDLFINRPKSSIDLRERLAAVHRPSARQAAVDKLAGQDLTDRDGPLILAILDVIGIGRERSRLVSTALNTKEEARVRMWAAMALAGDDPGMMDLLVTELGPEGMAHLAENALIDLITIQQPSRIGATVTHALEEWHRDLSSEKLLKRIELCRRGVGISCAKAYGRALSSRKLESLRPRILEYFVWEAADEDAEFLESLREKQDDLDRQKLQSALLRLRSAKIDPKRRAKKVAGRGLVSNCDGNGGFIVLGIFDNLDDTKSISELYLHVLGEILDGVIHPRLRPELADEIIEQLKTDAGCYFVQTGIEESAALASLGMEKITATSDREFEDIQRALQLFNRVTPSLLPSEAPPFAAAPPVQKNDIRELLARQEYEDTWVFDTSDLEAEGISLLDARTSEEDWMSTAQIRIADSPRLDQVVAMAEHMSRWHMWNNEKDTAALLAVVAQEARHNPNKCFLIRHMLERSHIRKEE